MGLNLLFVVGALGLFLAVPLVLMPFLDRHVGFWESVKAAGIGLALIGFFLFTMFFRTRWYRTRGIFISWRCFNEAILAAIGRPPLTREDIAILVAYSNERQVPDAPFANLYHVARSLRYASAESEEEFRRVADLLFRYLSNVHQVSQHTILKAYHPRTYRVGVTLGALWALAGVAVATAGVAAPGVGPGARGMLVGGGLWGVSVGIGLSMRWRWALVQGVLFLIAVEVACFYTAISAHADALAGIIVPGFYAPIFMGIYLYRRRFWFSGSPPKN